MTTKNKKLLFLILGIIVIFLCVATIFFSRHTHMQAIVFRPEIPVSEYWDYSSQYGTLDGLRLYVDSSGKNVVYALDASGRVVWKITASDYGLGNFDFMVHDGQIYLAANVKGEYRDNRGNVWGTLLAFDPSGHLLWSQNMPNGTNFGQQHVFTSNALIIVGFPSAGSGVRTSNGLVCPTKPAVTDVWAFDQKTGHIVWHDAADNFYGRYFDTGTGETIAMNSDGVGTGQYQFNYTMNANTGAITDEFVRVNDQNFTQDAVRNETLMLYPTAKKIQLENNAGAVLWSLPATSTIYKLVSRSSDGSASVYILNGLILVQAPSDNGHVLTYAFDSATGAKLWEKDFDFADYSFFKPQVNADVLNFTEYATYPTCRSLCLPYTVNCFSLADDSGTPACQACQKQTGLPASRVISVNAHTGQPTKK